MTYDTRWQFIREYVEKKSVLEFGPAELVGTLNRHKLERWLHRRISEVAARLVGVEKSPEQVRALSSLGYQIVEGDAEGAHLGESFDVVFAGELIEHLSNPGRFLDVARNHLDSGGHLVLTTPNRYSVLSWARLLVTGVVPPYEKPLAKHVLFFDGDSLASLLERHGFRVVVIDYCKWVGAPSPSRKERWLVDLTARTRPALLPVLLAVAAKR